MASSEQDEDSTARRVGGARTSGQNSGHWSAVVANERLTGLAGAVLLVLIAVELATVPTLSALLSVHVVVGMLLAGPLLVKLGSTGYRFVRYYTGSPAYVRKGPPRLPSRLLAPLLVATTLVVVGSGIALVVTGPTQAGPLILAHGLSTLIWLPLIAIHVFAYLWRVPRSLADDWSTHPAEHAHHHVDGQQRAQGRHGRELDRDQHEEHRAGQPGQPLVADDGRPMSAVPPGRLSSSHRARGDISFLVW